MAQKSRQRKTTTTKKRSSSTSSSKKKKNTYNKDFYNEIFLVCGLAISLLFLLSSFGIVGTLGDIINAVTFGLLGVTAYIFPLIMVFSVLILCANKGNAMSKKKMIYSVIFLFFVSAMIQLFNYDNSIEVSWYFKICAENKSQGGLIGALICAILRPLIGFWGAFIVLSAILIILVILISEKLIITGIAKAGVNTFVRLKDTYKDVYGNDDDYDDYDDYDDHEVVKRKPAKTYTFKDSDGSEQEDFLVEKKPKKGKKSTRKEDKIVPGGMREVKTKKEETPVMPVQTEKMQQTQSTPKKEEYVDKTTGEIFEKELFNKFGSKSTTQPDISNMAKQIDMAKDVKTETTTQKTSLPVQQEVYEEVTHLNPMSFSKSEKSVDKPNANKNQPSNNDNTNITDDIKNSMESVSNYQYPPLNLLTLPKHGVRSGIGQEQQMIARKLQETLNSFGVKVTVTDISVGPTVTRYEIQPEQGVKVSKITNLADDIKLNLAATDIRIEAPIPGKAAVGIEVPNKENSAVLLRELLESKAFKDSTSNIAFAVGKDLAGQPVVTDIAKMPHMLIAGQTGSGKSVCINTLIMSILFKYHPDDIKLIMIDPKVVELSVYNGIPHLLIPVVTDPKKASGALNWAVCEMVERYNKFAELGVRDMNGFNKKIESVPNSEEAGYKKMPKIVIIVDELADLMMVAPGEVEDAICRLAQMARAAGIHLIIATQRPSVNVITGLIKANVPSRIAFSVASAIDSRTILDGGGAEKLLGKGDMLFYPSGYPKPVRLQGAFVSDSEVSSVVEFLSNNAATLSSYNKEEIMTKIETASVSSSQSTGSNDNSGDERDQYFEQAGKFIIEKEKASIGMLQRVYKIGFNRAARIMDQLAEAGVVGPEEGTKPRKVLMTMQEFESYLEGNNVE